MNISSRNWILQLIILSFCLLLPSGCQTDSNGTGLAPNHKKALDSQMKAAEQGDANAQYIVGVMHYEGNGVEQDYGEAVKWVRKAAEQGVAYAQIYLGNRYYNDGQGVTHSYKEAAKWYREAAEQGYPPAQYSLGNMYYSGQGVAQDYKEAVKWWEKAAEQGHFEGVLFWEYIQRTNTGQGETKGKGEGAVEF